MHPDSLAILTKKLDLIDQKHQVYDSYFVEVLKDHNKSITESVYALKNADSTYFAPTKNIRMDGTTFKISNQFEGLENTYVVTSPLKPTIRSFTMS